MAGGVVDRRKVDRCQIPHRLRRGCKCRLHAHRELLRTSRVSLHSPARVPCTVTLVATSFTGLLYPSSCRHVELVSVVLLCRSACRPISAAVAAAFVAEAAVPLSPLRP